MGTKNKPVVYCGRGRPPKKALMNMPTDNQVREREREEGGERGREGEREVMR